MNVDKDTQQQANKRQEVGAERTCTCTERM